MRVQFRGRRVTLAELARALGIPYITIYVRYHRYGLRGTELTAPLHSRRPRPLYYTVGLSQAAWKHVLSDLRSEQEMTGDSVRARARVAQRYTIPYGAVAAAANGEWERLD